MRLFETRSGGGRAVAQRGWGRPAVSIGLVIVAIGALAGCGGDSGPSGTSVSLSTSQVSVASAVGAPAPTARVDIIIEKPPAAYSYWVSTLVSTSGVQSLYIAGSSIWLVFRLPSAVGPGTYHDSLTVKVCADQSCVAMLPGSPVTVPISYTVTP